MIPNKNTKIQWDIGTVYDLFISIRVLHKPDDFGVRASWAAGVRSRIPAEHREILEQLSIIRMVPLPFLYTLKEPKDSAVLLKKLRSMPAEKILENLSLPSGRFSESQEFFLNTMPGQKWTKEEISQQIQRWGLEENKETKQLFKSLNEMWANRKEFGERLIPGLQSYVDNFFAEEELRILPVLEQELSHARMRAGSRPLPAMLEEITAGVHYTDINSIYEIILAPTFWGSPLMFWQRLNDNKLIALFGARPGTMSIIPGDVVPDGLLRGMKALSDSTRLRILRYLAQEPQTAAELSRVLRLRPPTVNHHLSQLRLAGMVQVFLDSIGERKYAARYEGFEDTQDMLNSFVRGD
jgi:DNA-binding transcriptional ArsR family regulator